MVFLLSSFREGFLVFFLILASIGFVGFLIGLEGWMIRKEISFLRVLYMYIHLDWNADYRFFAVQILGLIA